MSGALVSTFERWKHHIIEEKQIKTKALRVVQQRLMSGALVSVFERRKHHIIEEKQIKTKAFKVVQEEVAINISAKKPVRLSLRRILAQKNASPVCSTCTR